jgi:starch synthase
MRVFHLSAECYPVAKAGGLGDVVGSLPKYLHAAGFPASVVMPYYEKPFVSQHRFVTVFEGTFQLQERHLTYSVLKEADTVLGFDLYLIFIPGLLDRPQIYSYHDEHIQFLAFQLAFLEWMIRYPEKPDVIHCHDHHTGLVPFLISYAYRYNTLNTIPTVFTIHNGQYQGMISWNDSSLLPAFDPAHKGLLDWDGLINPLASAIKCCWKYTTVSPGYLMELFDNVGGLGHLFLMEQQKGYGILNGIDTSVWDPSKDPMLPRQYNSRTVKKGKQDNKQDLCSKYGLDEKKPLIAFIGRLVGEKGADLLPEIIARSIYDLPDGVNFLVLGSGERFIENELKELNKNHPAQCAVYIGYNEELSHQVYAAADFIIMPSRVEPCGLNQLYSLRYGTMPVVCSTGGLKDTVIDFEEDENGYGIRFEPAAVISACSAIQRAVQLYRDTVRLNHFRKRMMTLDFSWQEAARQYMNLYKTLKPIE